MDIAFFQVLNTSFRKSFFGLPVIHLQADYLPIKNFQSRELNLKDINSFT